MNILLKNKKKWFIASGIIIVLAIILRIVVLFLTEKVENTYVGLGDSLAFGQLYDGKSGDSYVDYVAEDLIKNKLVNGYNKLFTKYGLTSGELLKIVEKNSAVLKDNKKYFINNILDEAKYVTISIGLQDIIKTINVDIHNKKLNYDIEVINRNLDIMQSNIFNIVEEIKNHVDEKNIYLVGYYFPYPSLKYDLEDEDKAIFDSLNDHIKEVASDTNTNYVDISSVSSTTFIPKEAEYHPCSEGYRYIALLVKNAIKE